jgi:branched-chain amino acid transport system substrate-binding protein
MQRLPALSCAAALAALSIATSAVAQDSKGPIKIGLMLPYSGTYASLGVAIENGFKLYVQEQGGKLGGRDIAYSKVDDESEPAKATDNVNKLIKRDNVDVLVGTVHSGVALAMDKAAKDNNVLLVIPNAGADAITGPLCAANVVRSSFSNWQPGYAMGIVAGQKGVKKAMTITWSYAAGAESTKGFTEGLEKGGGKVVKDLTLSFPGVEFQALLTEIAAQKPDAVYAFFAGGGAVKFVKDYAAAGLNKTIPLYGPGFLTDGTLEAQGAAAQGMLTTLHYADDLNTPKNNAFRKAYAIAYKAQPDVYAVQGYDAAQILAAGLKAAGGDLSKRDVITTAMHKTVVDSPRGKFTLSAGGNPIQDMYLREVKGNNNELRAVAVKALADPGRGCKL